LKRAQGSWMLIGFLTLLGFGLVALNSVPDNPPFTLPYVLTSLVGLACGIFGGGGAFVLVFGAFD
jgi:hypothetical protein